MSDFLVHFGSDAPVSRMASLLRDRPGMADAPIHTYAFPWGGAVIQEPRGKGFEPFADDGEMFACVGRPHFMGVTHEDHGSDGFNRLFAQRWRRGDRKELSDSLTGMFVLLHCDANGASILTDQMGFQPVYETTARNDRARLIGSHLEGLALLSERESDFDPVSLGELLVYNCVTYPYTSRAHIRELAPGSLICFGSNGMATRTTTLWQPCEPERFPERDETVDDVEDAVRTAVKDVTRGAKRVAVTLSGGMDSRTLLAALPERLSAAAITYVSRRNREVDIASAIASACHVEQMLCHREDEFFTDLILDRGPALLGLERRAMAHGFCIVDSGLHEQFDLILGGQLSDTFLKDHFMPGHERERLRPKYLLERGKRCVRRWFGQGDPLHVSPLSTIGRHLLESHLTKDIRSAVHSRRANRQRDIAPVRPRSAEEWSRFWPTSRQDDLAHVSGNMKLFSFDTPFMHRRVVETACRMAPRYRYGGQVAHQAFERIFGKDLARIENANTHLPANANGRAIRRAHHRRKKQRQPEEGWPSNQAPWNAVQGSWVDLRKLQMLSPRWQAYRRVLAESPSVDILKRVLSRDAHTVVRTYDEDLPPGMNLMVMQLVRVMDQLGQPARNVAVEVR